MKAQRSNWMNNPSKNQVIIYTVIWFVGLVLLTLSLTDLFTESMFQGKNMLVNMLLFGATGATIKLYYSYWKNKKVA